MIGERIELWHKEEYHYPAAHGFIPIMVSYIHEDELMHPAMLVVPGAVTDLYRLRKHIWLLWNFIRPVIMCSSLNIQ